MEGIAKVILISILVSVCILIFINLVFFSPWYMTIVIETFNLSQIAANDNYVKQYYYDDTLERLREAPIFNKRKETDQLMITVMNEENREAVGFDDETIYEIGYEDYEKPYLQEGGRITVRIDAVYPLSVTLWGHEYYRDFEVHFELTTAGLKHYKDLPEYY